MSDATDTLIATLEAGLGGKPDDARALAGLAELVAKRRDKPRAVALTRRALEVANGDPQIVARCRALLHSLVPGYHVPMMNDARRNQAWDRALRAAIAPGMHVLEIGTGAGMLALMAARAGAARVVTCERDPLLAALARELAARNGYADRISVIARRSDALEVGADMERRADLLFCDVFADDLFAFEPFAAIVDARARLLVPGAPAIPAAASLHVALAHWSEYDRAGHLDAAAGFDLSPMRDFVPAGRRIAAGDPGLSLLSAAECIFRFDLSQDRHADAGTADVVCVADRDGVANGVARWIRLALDGETALEARPEPGARFFSSPMFCPFVEPLAVRAGDRLRIAAHYRGKRSETWLAGRA